MANSQYRNIQPGAVDQGHAEMQGMSAPIPGGNPVEGTDWANLPADDPRWNQSLAKYPQYATVPTSQPENRPATLPFPPPPVMPSNLSSRNGRMHSAHEQQLHGLLPGQGIPRVPQEEEKQPLRQALLQPDAAANPMRLDPLPQQRSPHHSPHPSPPREPVVQMSQDDLKCIVCLDLHEVLLSDRSCGALLCEACAGRVHTCPNCRAPAKFERSAFLDRLMSNIEMRCRCGAVLTKREISKHKQVCTMEMATCPAMTCRDVRAMSKRDLMQHFQDIHYEEFMTAFVRQYPSVFP